MAVAGQNTRRPPARPENYCESKQTYFSYSLDKAFHSPEFQAKLFFTRNWVGGFYWDSLLNIHQTGRICNRWRHEEALNIMPLTVVAGNDYRQHYLQLTPRSSNFDMTCNNLLYLPRKGKFHRWRTHHLLLHLHESRFPLCPRIWSKKKKETEQNKFPKK